MVLLCLLTIFLVPAKLSIFPFHCQSSKSYSCRQVDITPTLAEVPTLMHCMDHTLTSSSSSYSHRNIRTFIQGQIAGTISQACFFSSRVLVSSDNQVD